MLHFKNKMLNEIMLQFKNKMLNEIMLHFKNKLQMKLHSITLIK